MNELRMKMAPMRKAFVAAGAGAGLLHSERLGCHRMQGRRLLARPRALCLPAVPYDHYPSRRLEAADCENHHSSRRLASGRTLHA